MKEFSNYKKKKFASVRKELAKNGFGSSLYASGGAEYMRLSKVVDNKEIHKAFKLSEDFIKLEVHRQVAACINYYNSDN